MQAEINPTLKLFPMILIDLSILVEHYK
jgi:hypothetical protein